MGNMERQAAILINQTTGDKIMSMNTVTVEFLDKDQNWQDEATVYWFELNGEQQGTSSAFEGDVFGVVESGNDEPRYVDCDGSPIDGMGDEPAIRVALADAVTDEHRSGSIEPDTALRESYMDGLRLGGEG